VEREGNGHAVIPAVVQRVLTIGPIVRLELEAEDGAGRDLIEVELPRERYRALDLHVGDRVFVGPRALRLFVN
jgi:sulfate/thiosulfate transport system ATP-binding protein